MPLSNILVDAVDSSKPSLRAYLAAQAVVSVMDEDYGAVADGDANDVAAINLACAELGKMVWMPKGNYKVTANPAVPVCSAILGEGEEQSIITCAAGVTRGLTLNGPQVVTLGGFKIVGNATTNAIGIVWGDTTATYACVENIRVEGFTGTGALGVLFKLVLKSSVNDLSVTGCTKNVLIEGTGGLPTTLTFNNLYAGTSLGIGVDILTGVLVTFNQSVFESNETEGMYVRPSVGDAVEITLNECWFEDNWNNDPVQYHLKVNPSNARTARVILNTVEFAGGARALHLTKTDTAATQATFNNLILVSAANQIVVDSGATGKCTYYGNTDPAITFTDTLGLVEGMELPWHNWTPVFSSNIGNAAATFTATPSLFHARYKRVGKTLFIEMGWSATLLAITPGYIQFTLPVTSNAANTMYRPGMAKDNNIYENGLFRGSGANAILQYRAQQGNYTVSSAVGGFFSGTVELA